jgi:hypothetical protein
VSTCDPGACKAGCGDGEACKRTLRAYPSTRLGDLIATLEAALKANSERPHPPASPDRKASIRCPECHPLPCPLCGHNCPIHWSYFLASDAHRVLLQCRTLAHTWWHDTAKTEGTA